MKNSLRFEIGNFFAQGILFLIFLGIAIIIILGFIPIRHHWLSAKAVSFLTKMGADSCVVQSVEVIAWKSVEIKGVSFRVSADSSHVYRVKVSDAVLPVNIIRFLLQRKKLYFALDKIGDGSLLSTCLIKPESVASGILALGNIIPGGGNGVFNDFWLNVASEGKTAFSGAGGKITLSKVEKSRDRIKLQVFFPIVTTFGDGVQNVQCTAVLSDNGMLVIEDLTGKYFDGRLRVKGSVALFDNLTVTYTANVDKVDMAYWYSVHVGIGEVTGIASVHCRGDGVSLQQIASKLDCAINIHKCTINNLPVQQSLATSLFIPSLRTTGFNKMVMRLRRNDGSDTLFASMEGTGEEICFSSSGWMLNDGALQQQISGTFSETMVSRFPPDIQPILASENDRSWKFRCRLYGTYSDPRIELDNETLKRAVGGMFTTMQQEIYEKLSK